MVRYAYNVYYSKQMLVWIGYNDCDELKEYLLSNIFEIEIFPLTENYDQRMEIIFKNNSKITIYKSDIDQIDWTYLKDKFER